MEGRTVLPWTPCPVSTAALSGGAASILVHIQKIGACCTPGRPWAHWTKRVGRAKLSCALMHMHFRLCSVVCLTCILSRWRVELLSSAATACGRRQYIQYISCLCTGSA